MIAGPNPLITLKKILNYTAATLSSQAYQHCAAVWEYLTNVKQGEWFTDGGSNHTQHLMRDVQWNTGPVSGMFCV